MTLPCINCEGDIQSSAGEIIDAFECVGFTFLSDCGIDFQQVTGQLLFYFYEELLVHVYSVICVFIQKLLPTFSVD